MQIIKILIVSVCLSLVTKTVSGQISFFKIYTNNGYDYGQGAVELEDSSYVICGSSSSYIDGPSESFLLKIDSLGTLIWSKHYGGSESDWARRVMYKSNFGFFVAGYTNSFGNGAYDAFLMKTDVNGGFLWQKTYGGTEWEKINDAALTRDTGTILVGESNSTVGGDNDLYIIRTDSEGDTLWTKHMGGLGEDFATSITKINDTTFVIGGQSYIADSLTSKGYLLCLRDDGTILWEDTIGAIGGSGINDVDFDPALNSVNFVGWQSNPTTNLPNNYFGKVQTNGSLNYAFSETSAGEKIYDHITRYGNAGKNYVAFRYIDASSNPDGYDLAISKLTQDLWWDGMLITTNFSLDDVAGQVIPTSDGGALVVGYISGLTGSGGGNVLAIKIGANDMFPVISQDPFPNSLVSVSEITTNDKISVFPNPANDILTITGLENELSTFQLFDMNGKVILENEFFSSTEISINTIESGVYLLVLSSEDKGTQGIHRVIIR